MSGSSENEIRSPEDVSSNSSDEHGVDSVLSRLVKRSLRTHGSDALRHLSILDQTSTLLAEAGPDLQKILQIITRQVAGLGVDLCVIRLLSEDGELLVPSASYHPDASAEELLRDILSVPQRADEGLHGYVVGRGEALLIPSLKDEEIWAIVRPHWRKYLERYGIHSVLVVPLRARGRVLGGLGVFRSALDDPYTYDDQILVQELADRAAMAIDNTRLYERLSDREQKLQDLVGKLILAQEEERRKVAYDVHDGLAQVAASSHQHLQAFAFQHGPNTKDAQDQLDRCLDLSRQTIREARRVIADLRPTALDDFGLAAAVRLQVEELRSEGWEIEFVEEIGDQRLPPAIETALFRVAQEALSNVRKHAGDSRVYVALGFADDEVRLTVQDWGKGFDPLQSSNGSRAGERVGLPGMRERVTLIGGTCVIESTRGQGTSVHVRVPRLELETGDSK